MYLKTNHIEEILELVSLGQVCFPTVTTCFLLSNRGIPLRTLSDKGGHA